MMQEAEAIYRRAMENYERRGDQSTRRRWTQSTTWEIFIKVK